MNLLSRENKETRAKKIVWKTKAFTKSGRSFEVQDTGKFFADP